MSRENVKGLFDYLDEQLTNNACDDTLKLSVSFLRYLKLDNIEEITKWLSENGGVVIVKCWLTWKRNLTTTQSCKLI